MDQGEERRWDSDSTKLLLQMYYDRREEFLDPMKRKRDVWKSVLLELEEHGICDINAQQLDRKFRNLKKTYEAIKNQKRQTRRSTEVLYLPGCPEDQNEVDDDSHSASTNSKSMKMEPEVIWEAPSPPMVNNSNMHDTEASSLSESSYSMQTKEKEVQCISTNSSAIVDILQNLVKEAKELPIKPPFKNMEVLTYWDFLLNDMTPEAAREARHRVTNLLQNSVTANPKK
ncbi:uncharacterized protein LOC117583755 isoform X3 [Drosophila guanche]|uniref:uncharacterized protein LOC117583755 isoform X3 n=1 Tax=Drosophila guanche TaxID=7266 RepID=UPI001471E7A7|nr:uncharacterized protein LOC117583755 isoform X3 [Drosophila guanche]